MSLRRPTVACLSFIYVISPFCGVALTPDCGIIILAVSSRGVIQTLVWHPVFYFGIFLTICVHHGLSHISWQACDHLINPEPIWYIIPVFLIFASTFKRTHWLVPGYCLGQISLRGGMHRGDNLGTYAVDVCNLAKIGVILVSCSCGKWSPIDADEPQTASAINH